MESVVQVDRLDHSLSCLPQHELDSPNLGFDLVMPTILKSTEELYLARGIATPVSQVISSRPIRRPSGKRSSHSSICPWRGTGFEDE